MGQLNRKWLKSKDNVVVVDGSRFENRSSRLMFKSKQPSRFCSLRLLQYSSNVLTPSTYLRFARIMEFGANRIPTGSPRQRVSFGVCNVIIPRMIRLSATWRCV
ncbi:hypothetical protein HanIR_Chr04g0201671 [Helianthus annuus]|nr:hypothetical protein HanIR_Chr04g0201671 [Helianthus annuus]